MGRITSLGPGGVLGAAAIPPWARDAGGWQSRGRVSVIVTTPAPAPGGTPQSWNRALHRSSDAPNSINPRVYFVSGPQIPLPVSVTSDNQLPVPATDPRGTPAVMSRRPVFIGQTQVVQPRATISYPNRNRRARNG